MSGTLQASVVKDSASSTNNLALDASGNVTVGNNLTVTGTTTFTGGFSGALTAPAFIPSGSTVPTNGMYLSAANTLNLSTNTTNQVQISSAGIVTGTAGNLMLVQGTAVASTSGTSIDFTGIPSWVKKITIMLNVVSTNGSSIIEIRLGTGGVAEATGYNAIVGGSATASVARALTSTTGFVTAHVSTASDTYSGSVVFTNLNGNIWTCSGNLCDPFDGYAFSLSGVKTLGGVLNMVRVTTQNGTDTFDAGSINILYE